MIFAVAGLGVLLLAAIIVIILVFTAPQLFRKNLPGEYCSVDATDGTHNCGDGLNCVKDTTDGAGEDDMVCQVPATGGTELNETTCAAFCPAAASETTCSSFCPSGPNETNCAAFCTRKPLSYNTIVAPNEYGCPAQTYTKGSPANDGLSVWEGSIEGDNNRILKYDPTANKLYCCRSSTKEACTKGKGGYFYGWDVMDNRLQYN